MDEYEVLKFASLFHDIGKFYQRADNMGRSKPSYDSRYSKLNQKDFGQNGAHSKWSADFVSKYFDNAVEELVLYHHEPAKSGYGELCKMLQKADHHSSKERIKSADESEVLDTPLTSIFSRISLDGKIQDDYYIPLIALDFFNKKGLHPKKVYEKEGSNLVPEYKRLWGQFVNEFEKLKNKNFESSLALIKKYTSTMPSAAYKDESDISLYDHLKTTVAIANCRYLYSLDSNLNLKEDQYVYKVINGDISGIQNFIYKVQTPEEAQSGMSKRLRGRSLYLSLLCEAIAYRIIIDLNLDSTNILFCGGGRFTILAPNTTKTNETIDKLKTEINKDFIDKFNSELFLNMAFVEACGEDLGKFDDILSKLTQLLNENKKHKFLGQLDDVFYKESKDKYKLCPVCGNPTLNKFCEDCSEHESLGGAVANAKYLIKYVSDNKIERSFFFSKLDIGYIFADKKSDVLNIIENNSDLKLNVYKLNDTDFVEFDIDSPNVSFDFKVIGNSIPSIGNTPLYFNHLAEISKGSNKLGVLKMDVDNLGLIFSKGFKHLNNGNGGASISRISSLSFYLDLFFLGRINQIVEKFNFTTELPEDNNSRKTLQFVDDKGDVYKSTEIYRPEKPLPKGVGTSTIHINYSGGDDLLVVGPYDYVILFAQEFRERFKKWTAENNSINISAGISIVSPKFPIGKAALMADEELEKSKDCGRDKITVFGEVLSWDVDKKEKYCGFNELLSFGEYLEELYDKKQISKGFIYSLLKIWQSRSDVEPLSRFNEDSWKDKNGEKIVKKRFVPIFKYKLRIIKDKDIRKDLDKKGLKIMPWIKTPVSWASLRLR